jgi:hypothetical protein
LSLGHVPASTGSNATSASRASSYLLRESDFTTRERRGGATHARGAGQGTTPLGPRREPACRSERERLGPPVDLAAAVRGDRLDRAARQ